MTERRAFKYRFYPTPQQEEMLLRTFGCVRYVYNRALEERTMAFRRDARKIGYHETSANLTSWKREDRQAFLNEVPAIPLQQSLRHLQSAFSAFFAKRSRYPRFKAKRRARASAEFTKSAFTFTDGLLILAKMPEPLNIVWSRPLPEGTSPSTVTASRDASGRWFVSLRVEDPTVQQLPPSDRQVGLDVGLTTLATTSDGEKIANPRHERIDRKKLACAQRALARKEKGSANRAKAQLKVARVHARIADRRSDHLHKLSTRLIRENQTVVIEDLSVRNMVKNRSLARAISCAAWRSLRSMLEYKAAWYGRELLVVDRWFPSSKLCSSCGRLAAGLPLKVRSWTCSGCGSEHDRDLNAAKNILAAGLAER